jgi:hypothetical protein
MFIERIYKSEGKMHYVNEHNRKESTTNFDKEI